MSRFEFYLRTGLHLPGTDHDELKFNPWHDPDDGRFTFRNQGVNYGGGRHGRTGAGEGKRPRKPKQTPWGGYGGGDFGGGGGGQEHTFPSPSSPRRTPPINPHPRKLPKTTPPATATDPQPRSRPNKNPIRHVLERNGYRFGLDAERRTRVVTGELRLVERPVRSRAAQAGAGGTSRRPDDDGGHFVAARFGGPTEKFNHFAQNGNFNRGAYRKLEDDWAGELKLGKPVSIKIEASYTGLSQRPDQIIVRWKIGKAARRRRIFGNQKHGIKSMDQPNLGDLYARIGEFLLTDVQDKDGTYFVYAEVEPEVVDLSIYQEFADELVYIEPDSEISESILDAWYAEPEDQRWIAMEYRIADGRFAVQLHYPGEIDIEDDDHREKLLAQRFPGKTVYYPPLEDDIDWDSLERL